MQTLNNRDCSKALEFEVAKRELSPLNVLPSERCYDYGVCALTVSICQFEPISYMGKYNNNSNNNKIERLYCFKQKLFLSVFFLPIIHQ